MVIHQLNYLLVLLLTAFYCHDSYAFVPCRSSSNDANFREFPCPKAEDIAPCICTYDIEDEVMDMDCSGVTDEQELYDVFHAEEMIHIYRTLIISSSPLPTLSDDVFGEATFETVSIQGGMLKSIGPNTFKKSVSTLRYFYLQHNQLTDFPFESLEEYSILGAMVIYDNPLHIFPPTLRSEGEVFYSLIMYNTFIHDIPAGSLYLPQLKEIQLQDTWIDSIAKEAFVGLPDIRNIIMANTGLRHLESLQFAVTSPLISQIVLQDNFIESVEPDTFKGVQSGSIILRNNKLTILPEDTWKPVLDAGVNLFLDGNDLTCGCDIAWLVLEPTYHALVETAICHNGESLVNLDTYFYENFC